MLWVGTEALLVAALMPLIASTSWTIEVPTTLHARLRVTAAGAGPPGDGSAGARTAQASPEARAAGAEAGGRELPFAVTHLGFEWEGSEEGPEVRTSPDGNEWSWWERLEVSEDLSDHERGIFFSPLVSAPGARHVELRDRGYPGRTITLSAINVRDGPRRSVQARRSASAATPEPRIIRRTEWGADESMRSGRRSFARVGKIFVHHTVTNDDLDPAGTVRAIYSYHTQSRGWDDIGYNFLIDSRGNVYEGRSARTYASNETSTGEDANGMGVVGAHVAGYNTGTLGVAILGDFQLVQPPEAAVEALVEFLAWKSDRHGIDPLATDMYINPATGLIAAFPNIAGHRDTDVTACPGDFLYGGLPEVRSRVEERIRARSGLTPPAMPTGTELKPGGASKELTPGATGAASRSAVRVDLTFDGTRPESDRVISLAPRNGSFALTDDDYGGIALHQDGYVVRAVAYDSLSRASPAALVASDYLVSIIGPPAGYWIMGADGGIFSFGSAPFHGSTGGMRLNAPAVGMDATPKGDGYWIVASDGGIFSFGAGGFYGSMGATRLNRPVVDLAATQTGLGYWLVASDGGIFTFGDARFFGSTGGIRLNEPIVGMAPTPTGGGYWLVASDGGIFSFGDARFFGSSPGLGGPSAAARMASTPTGDGYYIVGRDGSIRAFGAAPTFGDAAPLRIIGKDLALVR